MSTFGEEFKIYEIFFDFSKTKTNDVKFIEIVAKFLNHMEYPFGYPPTIDTNTKILKIFYQFLYDAREGMSRNTESFIESKEFAERRRISLNEVREKKLFKLYITIYKDDTWFYGPGCIMPIIDSIDSTVNVHIKECTIEEMNNHFDKVLCWYFSNRFTIGKFTDGTNIENDIANSVRKMKEMEDKKMEEKMKYLTSMTNNNCYDILSAEEARNIHKLDKNDREREVKLILSIVQDKIITASNKGYSSTTYTFGNGTYDIEAVNTVTDILNIKGYSASRLTEKSLTGSTTISVSWSINVESINGNN